MVEPKLHYCPVLYFFVFIFPQCFTFVVSVIIDTANHTDDIQQKEIVPL